MGPRTLLEHFIRQSDFTYEETAERFDRTAHQIGERASITARHLRRLAALHAGKPNPSTRRVLKAVFGRSSEELLSPPDLVQARDPDAPAEPVFSRMLHPRPAAPIQGPVAPELIMYFLEQLPGHYRADMLLGSSRLIPTVLSQADLLGQLAGAADTEVRRGLLGASVAYAALLGWLYQDAGDVKNSALWRSLTLDLAHRSRDADLISYALTNKAMLAVDIADGAAVLDYAEAALANPDQLSAKTQVLALVHQAHGHSLLPQGDKATVDRLLDRAATQIDQIDDEHPWGNACRRTDGYIEIQRATAYVRLGAYSAAVTEWEQILGRTPQTARRDSGVFRARQARALAAMCEPERVVDIASATAVLVSETGSARLRRELVEIPRQARAWQASRAGRQLSEIIATISEPTGRAQP